MEIPPLKDISLHKILHDKTLRKAVSMVLWRLFSLVLTFSSSVWVARCLGPEEMGRSGFILATGSQVLLFLVVCPNTFAIRRVKESNGSADAIASIVTARACMSILYLAGLAVAALCGFIPASWSMLVLIGFLYPVLIALDAGWLLQAQENQAAQYKSGAVLAVVAFAYAAIFIRPGGYAAEDLTSRMLSTFAGLAAAWWFTRKGTPFRYIKLTKWRRAVKAFWESRILLLTEFVVYIFIGLELPLLAYLSTVEELGMYRTAVQLVSAGNSFLIMLPMLYYPRFIEWQKISSIYLWKMQKRFFFAAVVGVIPVSLVTLAVGPWAYGLVFGAEFSPAGLPFALLLVSKLVVVINGIFAWGLWARSKDGAMLGVMVVVAVFSLCSNLFFIPLYGMLGAASINLASEVLMIFLTIWMAKKNIRKDELDLFEAENR